MSPGGTINLQITGRGGVPATGVSAVALNLTATGPTADTFVTAYPTGITKPLASNLNLVAGQTVPNRVIVKVGTNGQISLFNLGGTVHLIVDVAGWFTDNTDADAIGGRFTGITPVRVLEHVAEQPGGRWRNGESGDRRQLRHPVHGQRDSADGGRRQRHRHRTDGGGLPDCISVAGALGPLASDLNFVPGQTVPNLVIAKLGPDGKLSIFNNAGNSHIVVDVLGWYSGDVVISEKAKILGPAAINALSGNAGPDTTTLIFNPIPSGLSGVAVGDVIVTGANPKTPAGLLKEVTNVQVNGSTLTLTVINGSLSDVIVQGDLSGAAPLDATNVVPGGPAVPASAPASDDVETQASIGFSHGLSLAISKTFENSNQTLALSITGSDTFEAGFTLEANWRCCFGVDAKAEVSFSKKLALTATGDSGDQQAESQPLGVRPPVGSLTVAGEFHEVFTGYTRDWTWDLLWGEA